MNFLVDLATTCDDVALANVLVIVKRALLLLRIFGPILCIISLILIFTKGTFNPDDKKMMKTVFNTVLAMILLFFVPIIVNAVIGLLGDANDFSRCWNTDNSNITISRGNYDDYDDDNDDKISPLIDPDKYNPNNESAGTGDSNSIGATGTTSSSTNSSLVLIGDSRVVQTYEYLSGDWGNQANYSGGGVHTADATTFVAEGGKGLSWLKQTGIPASKSYFDAGKTVVIMLGVNDIKTPNIANSYASYINSNIDSWTSKGSKVYFAAVTPCNGNYESFNSYISNFNSTLKSSLSNKVCWIDTDTYIRRQGYQTVDGLHYNQDTYLKIYNYIKNKV